MTELIPSDLREFILEHIESITQLEALVLLRGNPEGVWSVPKATARLYTTEEEVAAALVRLCESGLLSCEDEIFKYAPKNETLHRQAERLVALYATHLIPVTNLIHSKLRRIQEFAGAFKFRKDR